MYVWDVFVCVGVFVGISVCGVICLFGCFCVCVCVCVWGMCVWALLMVCSFNGHKRANGFVF